MLTTEDPGSLRNPCGKGRELVEGRLGGTSDAGDPDGWFAEMWLYLVREFSLKSALDVGCGVGFAQKFFHDCGLDTLGVDGSQLVLDHHLLKDQPGRVLRHDLATGPLLTGRVFDIVWSCECGEHIPAEHSQHFVDTIAKNAGLLVAVCMAPGGAGGHHHVNCQDPDYWVGRFAAAGLRHEAELTEYCRSLCDESNGRCQRNYFRRSGLIFTNPVVNHLKKAE